MTSSRTFRIVVAILLSVQTATCAMAIVNYRSILAIQERNEDTIRWLRYLDMHRMLNDRHLGHVHHWGLRGRLNEDLELVAISVPVQGPRNCDGSEPPRPEIKSLKRADVSSLRLFPKLESAMLAGCDISDASLHVICANTELREMYISRCPVTDAACGSLANESRLETLHLGGTQIGDSGLAELCSLSQLRQLGIENTKITSAGLSSAVRRFPLLKYLSIDVSQLDDDCVASIHNSPSLLALELHGQDRDMAIVKMGLSKYTDYYDRHISEFDFTPRSWMWLEGGFAAYGADGQVCGSYAFFDKQILGTDSNGKIRGKAD